MRSVNVRLTPPISILIDFARPLIMKPIKPRVLPARKKYLLPKMSERRPFKVKMTVWVRRKTSITHPIEMLEPWYYKSAKGSYTFCLIVAPMSSSIMVITSAIITNPINAA